MTIRKNGAGPQPDYEVQNQHYRVIVSTSNGGRIVSLFDSVSGCETTWDGGPGQLGGLLDDRQKFTAAPYKHSISFEDKDRVALRLEAEDHQGLRIVKTLTFRDGSPTIQVDYDFSNASQRPVTMWNRNFVFPGGTGADASWLKGAGFSSAVRLTFSADGKAYVSEEFRLVPHSHADGHGH